MSEDPIGFSGGSLNIYSYLLSNPIRFTDPLGLTQKDIDVAFQYAYLKYPDARNVTYRIANPGELRDKVVGKYLRGSNEVIIHKKYLGNLCDPEATKLLDTAFHELAHSQDLWTSIMDAITEGEGRNDPYHNQIYIQAEKDAKSVKVFFNFDRKR